MEYTALKLGAEENGTVRIELGWLVPCIKDEFDEIMLKCF
jgi:hypothetical protein